MNIKLFENSPNIETVLAGNHPSGIGELKGLAYPLLAARIHGFHVELNWGPYSESVAIKQKPYAIIH